MNAIEPRLPQIGETIDDRYVVERDLARGGMGAVFVARHKTTNATVALKVLLAAAGLDETTRGRFVREARVASTLTHPGIIKVFDAGDDPNVGPYLAMELLSGESFDKYISRENPAIDARLNFVREMLDALACAHAASVIHRDIKPENVFLADDGEGGVRVKLLDFGIAREQKASAQTQDGTALGTIYYMAPEQMMDARRVTPAADVWSVGVMLFELITGQLPFDGATIHEVAVRVCTQPIPQVLDLVPDLDFGLAQLIQDCLNRDIDQRPRDAQELTERLDALGIESTRSTRLPASVSRASVTPSSAPRAYKPIAMGAEAARPTMQSHPDGVDPLGIAPLALAATLPETQTPAGAPAARRRSFFVPVALVSLLGIGFATALLFRFATQPPVSSTSVPSGTPRVVAEAPATVPSPTPTPTPAPIAPTPTPAPEVQTAEAPTTAPVVAPAPSSRTNAVSATRVRATTTLAPASAPTVEVAPAPTAAVSTAPTPAVVPPNPFAAPTPPPQPAASAASPVAVVRASPTLPAARPTPVAANAVSAPHAHETVEAPLSF